MFEPEIRNLYSLKISNLGQVGDLKCTRQLLSFRQAGIAERYYVKSTVSDLINCMQCTTGITRHLLLLPEPLGPAIMTNTGPLPLMHRFFYLGFLLFVEFCIHLTTIRAK